MEVHRHTRLIHGPYRTDNITDKQSSMWYGIEYNNIRTLVVGEEDGSHDLTLPYSSQPKHTLRQSTFKEFFCPCFSEVYTGAEMRFAHVHVACSSAQISHMTLYQISSL